jgi:ABC-type phosphate/phosphonate transport system substrate-binding protein
LLILEAGSHLNAIEMVRSKQADAAAVDANALAHVNKNLLEKDTGEIKVLTSIGPLPPYPILVNATLPGLNNSAPILAFKLIIKFP